MWPSRFSSTKRNLRKKKRMSSLSMLEKALKRRKIRKALAMMKKRTSKTSIASLRSKRPPKSKSRTRSQRKKHQTSMTHRNASLNSQMRWTHHYGSWLHSLIIAIQPYSFGLSNSLKVNRSHTKAILFSISVLATFWTAYRTRTPRRLSKL